MTVPADHPSVTDRAGWRALRAAVLKRAGHRCETCRAPNHVPIWRHAERPGDYMLSSGEVYDGTGAFLADCRAMDCRDSGWEAKRGVLVVLTIAHTCACSPPCLRAEHVSALCQRDHLRLDAGQHRANAARTRRRRDGQATLPGVEP